MIVWRKNINRYNIKCKEINQIFPSGIGQHKKKVIASIRDYNPKTKETHIWYDDHGSNNMYDRLKTRTI